MVGVNPIPIGLLPHAVSVRVPVDSLRGGEFSDEPVMISNVRFVRACELNPNNYTMADGSKGLLFIDRINSAGAFEIPVGSLIKLPNYEEACAVQVTPCEVFLGCTHHWEVEVA